MGVLDFDVHRDSDGHQNQAHSTKFNILIVLVFYVGAVGCPHIIRFRVTVSAHTHQLRSELSGNADSGDGCQACALKSNLK